MGGHRPFKVDTMLSEMLEYLKQIRLWPENSAILVKAIESDALTPPVGFTEIWRDIGSGGNTDVRFLKMEPQSGYSCLGEVAFASWDPLPDYYQKLFR